MTTTNDSLNLSQTMRDSMIHAFIAVDDGVMCQVTNESTRQDLIRRGARPCGELQIILSFALAVAVVQEQKERVSTYLRSTNKNRNIR